MIRWPFLDNVDAFPGVLLGASVDDVERVAQGFVEASSRDFVEVADGMLVQVFEMHRDHVVAADDACFGQAMFDAEFHL